MAVVVAAAVVEHSCLDTFRIVVDLAGSVGSCTDLE